MAENAKSVFISYRRDVSGFVARAVFQSLQAGGFDVFMDLESLASGEFVPVILNQIAARPHFLVILEPDSVSRLADEGDWLRREIERAIDLQRNIVPLLASGFGFQEHGASLPGKLARLAKFNAVTLPREGEYFDAAMDRLKERFLKQRVTVPVRPTPPGDRPALRILEERLHDRARDRSADSRVTPSGLEGLKGPAKLALGQRLRVIRETLAAFPRQPVRIGEVSIEYSEHDLPEWTVPKRFYGSLRAPKRERGIHLLIAGGWLEEDSDDDSLLRKAASALSSSKKLYRVWRHDTDLAVVAREVVAANLALGVPPDQLPRSLG